MGHNAPDVKVTHRREVVDDVDRGAELHLAVIDRDSWLETGKPVIQHVQCRWHIQVIVPGWAS